MANLMWGQGADTTGTAALIASIEAFPDMVMTFDQMLAEDDLVLIRWTINGTQTGPFFGNEPTWTGINMYRISCGKVIESWSEADGLGLREQLGLLDDPAAPAS